MDQDIHPQRRHCLQLLAGLGLTASSAHLRIAAATQAQEQGPAHGQAQTPGKEQEQRQGQKQGQEQARLQGRAQRQGQTQEPSTASGEVIVARFGGRTGLPAPEHIRRVFAAGPPAGVLVAVLAPEKLLGWPTPLADGARALLGPALRNLPVTGRLAGRGNTVPLEALIEQAPDLVLDAGTADATYVSGVRRVSEQTGLPTVLIQGRIGEQAAQLREVGHLLGTAERGARLAGEAQHFIDLATRIRNGIPPAQRPRVYFGRGTDGLETARPGSINAELLDFCGGHNVAASMKQGLTGPRVDGTAAAVESTGHRHAGCSLCPPGTYRSALAGHQRRAHGTRALRTGAALWLAGQPPGRQPADRHPLAAGTPAPRPSGTAGTEPTATDRAALLPAVLRSPAAGGGCTAPAGGKLDTGVSEWHVGACRSLDPHVSFICTGARRPLTLARGWMTCVGG